MKRKCLRVFVLSSMILTISGCGRLFAQGGSELLDVLKNEAGVSENAVETEDTQEEISTEQSEEEKEQEEQQLYNNYIAIYNSMVGRVEKSLSRYFNYVDMQEEFKLLDEEDGDFDCHSISESDIELVEEIHETIEAKTEKSAVDQSFLALYPSLKTVMETLNKIYNYTDMKSYLDDDYARAREYHAALMSVYTEYQATGEAFLNEMEIVADAHQEETLARLKEEGQEVLYAVNMVISLAEDIEEELERQGVWDDNILDMDVEAIDPLYNEFVSYVEQVLEYSGDSEKLAAEGLNSGSLSSFSQDMKDAKVSLTEVMQKVKNGEPLSDSDLFITEIAGHCSLSSFDTGVSEMIRDYNTWIAR